MLFVTHLFHMTLHFKGCVELLVAMLALCQVTQIEVLLLFTINVALHVHHNAEIVIKHFVTKPALKQV